MDSKHGLTIKRASPSTIHVLVGKVWYYCSCGSSGTARDTEAEATKEFQIHVDSTTAADRLERIRDAAPALLAALEELVPLADEAFTTVRYEFSALLEKEGLAIDQARAAIEASTTSGD